MRAKRKKVVEINYPPLTTKTWIPPDQRPKRPKKPPPYTKPEGIDQKLTISTLRKIWHQFVYYDQSAILVGHFGQTSKKYLLKSRGLQGACNCAVACIFAYLFPMNTWNRYTIDRILDLGDELYVKSIQQDPDRCLVDVTTDKIFRSIFVDRDKISFEIDCKNVIEEKFTSVAEDKVKEKFMQAAQTFFKQYPSGIVTMTGKYVAIWIQDDAYYMFDPTEHTEDGFPAYGVQCHIPSLVRNYPRYPLKGEGFAVIYRCTSLEDLIHHLYLNLNVHIPFAKFMLEGCTVQRFIHLNLDPPERLEDLEIIKDQMLPLEQLLEKKRSEPGFDVTEDKLTTYLNEAENDADPKNLEILELAPCIDENVSLSKRHSWLQDTFEKADVCKFPIPYKKRPENVTFYIDLPPPKSKGIMRAGTHQSDPNFSRYKGRQSMGNSISALVMLKFHKSAVWVPSLLNKILKHGDLLYRDAMITIPRTQELKLSNFQKKTEYLEKVFMPKVEDFVVVGRLISSNFEVLDLFTALESFLIDNICCVIIGPIILSVWVEDGKFYTFDPNGRDHEGRLISPEALEANPSQGKGCAMWFAELRDFVDHYMDNVPKAMRLDPFYLSKVLVTEYIELPEAWYEFKGILRDMWILRGSTSQSDRKFDLISRNFQSPAICLVMLTMVQLIQAKEFTKETLDEILMTGDTFYKESVTTLMEKEQYNNKMLMLPDIKRNFKWGDKMVDYDIEECFSNGIFDCTNTTFQKAIHEYFGNYESGIITIRAMSIVLWKSEDMFYYFDSHNRDDKGLATPYGTACIVRSSRLQTLIEILMANFTPTTENYYNIHRVKITFSEVDADDLIRPIMEFYKRLHENKSILRSLYSEISNKFDLNIRKQTIPMCIMAIGFNRLKPSIEWNQQDLDEIVNKGDGFYTDCITDILKEEELLHLTKIRTGNVPPEGSGIDVDLTPEEEGNKEEEGDKEEDEKKVKEDEKKLKDAKETKDTKETKEAEEEPTAETTLEGEEVEEEEAEDEHAPIEITLDNMRKEFNIGFNKFNFETEDIAEGLVRPELKNALKEFLEAPQTDDYFHREMMLLTKPYSVILWRDDHVFYLFDPKPRDKEGYVIGLEDWSALRLPVPPKKKKHRKHGVPPQGEGFIGGEGGYGEDMGEEEGYISESSEEIVYPPMDHKSSSFWREKEKAGKACVLAFNQINELIEHVYANIPPKLTPDTKFKLKSLKLVNCTETKQRFNPECERSNVYEGNWYDFEEIDNRMWILRGTMSLCNELFPQSNRGKQQLTTAYVALAMAFIFSIICFHEHSVDSILKYGDKLLTFIKNYRRSELKYIGCGKGDKKDRLRDEEIDWVVQHEDLTVNDIPKKVCIAKFMVNVDVEPAIIVGDIKAQDFEDTLDIQRGLVNFFENHQYGILEAKGLTVAIWRGARMYYMFDGFNRGRNGIVAPYGTACVTRFMDIERLGKTFLANLPQYGNNCFVIHSVTMIRDICPREREPNVVIPPPKTVQLGGFKEVIPGKSIVRGTITQNDPKFEKLSNSLSAPIAIIALTMTLLHKTNTWSKPIINEVVELGAQLYDDTMEVLGFDFNPWEEQLDLARVNSQYNIGVVRASCEIRIPNVRGVIDIKDRCTLNLRQGIDKFFEENTHGVIVSEPILVAIWEEIQEDNKPIIYIFDPNSRGPTGLPINEGTACLVSFLNAEMASEHIHGCILEPDKKICCFEIVPVEIVVGTERITSYKQRKSRSRGDVSSPRCALVSEDKKFLRKYVEMERRKKEAKRIRQLGRKDYYLTKSGDYLLRGYKSQNSPCFNACCRNKQDIPNCLVATVMNHLVSVDRWSSKNIDLILTAGNQLYIDSYIAYGPKDLKLGMENIVRKFFLKHLTIHITIYKPIISEMFNEETLFRVLSVFFTQEPLCILNHADQWVTLFFKAGQFYMFDPHECDLEGYRFRKECCGCGAAILMRFEEIGYLVSRLLANLTQKRVEIEEEDFEGEDEVQNNSLFTVWITSVEIK